MTDIQHNKRHIIVSVSDQLLHVFQGDSLDKTYLIATAKNGIGQREGSECTPLGKHCIAEKIGMDAPVNAIFVGRQWQQEIYSETLAKQQPDRDWILTRILWLDGLETGFNSGLLTSSASVEGVECMEDSVEENQPVSCDTKSRYIYIHGCPDSHAMQIPSSHGCIKMRNADIIELFELVDEGVEVNICTEYRVNN